MNILINEFKEYTCWNDTAVIKGFDLLKQSDILHLISTSHKYQSQQWRTRWWMPLFSAILPGCAFFNFSLTVFTNIC